MTYSLRKKSWWVSLCCWLWAPLKWIWGAIITAVLTLLISPQSDLTKTPIGWLLNNLYTITIPVAGSLIVFSIVIGLVVRVNDQSDQRPHPSILEKQEERNRDSFLKRLRRNYDDRMKQSLPKNVPSIALCFHSKPDMVKNNTHQPGSGSALPAGTSINTIYDEANGELLILGDPGAGKTTLLLQLAQDLRDRAEQNSKEPLPVIINLSTWADARLSLSDWLIEEVARIYAVPHPLSAYFVEHNHLLLLLDGLDEVPDETRSACIEAINKYKQNYFGSRLVVCCRAREYSALPCKLALQDTVIVQPLEAQQINSYFQTTGSSLNSTKEAYRSLHDLVKTPLMLSMLILSSKGQNIQPVPALPEPKIRRIRLKPVKEQQRFLVEEQQELLLNYYLNSRLKKYSEEFHVSPEQVRLQLTWLARQMQQRNLKTFYLEQMQPDWLQATQTYEKYAVQWPGILIGVLLSLLVNALLFNSFDPIRFIVYALIGGHIGNLFSKAQIRKQAPDQRMKLYPHLIESLGNSILIGLVVWLSVWFIVGRAYTASDWLHNGIATGLYSAMSVFLLSLLHNKKWQASIKAKHLSNGVRVGLGVGLTFGLGTWLFFTLQDGANYGITFGIRNGLAYGLTFGLIGILLSIILVGKDIRIQPTEILTWSWRSLWESLLRREHQGHTLLVGLSVGLGIGMSFGLSTIASQWIGGRSFGLDFGLAVGLGTSLGDGLAYGLTFGIAYWLLLGLFKGLSSNYLPSDGRMKPNEGIWRSARFSMWAGLSCGIVSGLIGVLSMMLYFGLHTGLGQGNIGLSLGWQVGVNNALSIGLDNGLIAGLQVGLFGGLLACVLMGGLACLRHSVLRLLLWQSHNIPLDYPRFLDRATHSILLRKVGGGYEFFHDLLRDHLLL